MNSKKYKLPNGKTAVFEYDVCGIGKITLECMDELMGMIADRPQGEWIKFGLGRGTRILFCTNCERRIEVPLSQGDSNYDFCPNCGAKMKGAGDE